MDRRARFEYGGTGAFECLISARPWNPIDDSVGGSRTSATGVPASYTVRRDALVEVNLRFWESEWADFLNLLIYGQTGASFTWFPDADELASYTVYLETPKTGERFSPTRSGEFPRVFEASILLRGAGIAIPWQAYFD
jgi:hypothetical protein